MTHDPRSHDGSDKPIDPETDRDPALWAGDVQAGIPHINQVSAGAPYPIGLSIGPTEFVTMMAALMAVSALGVDMMLPALPAIGHELGVSIENHRQWVITAYFGGFGVAQLVFGPLADRFGRKRVLLYSIILYAIMSVLAAQAHSFALLLVVRSLQGAASASTRVLSISIIRDCYAGHNMARLMSLCFLTFLAVPVLAPSLGQLILLVEPWRWIFYALAAYSLCIFVWVAVRLPETLAPAMRRQINLADILQATRLTLSDRYSVGYTFAMAGIFGGMSGFLNSGQQIFSDIYTAADIFPIAFGAIAGSMAVSALLNSRIVGRFGTHRVAHSALILLTMISLIHVAVILLGMETLASFCVLLAATVFCLGFTGPNFGSMAMEHMGAVAASASSVQGFLLTLISTLIGLAIGQSFAGTPLPLAMGFLLAAIGALVAVLVIERGRLFQPA